MVNLLWWPMFFIYQLCFPLLAIGIVIRFLLDGLGPRLAEGPQQLRQRLGLLNSDELKKIAGSRVLWVHAASVGEVNAAAPLLKAVHAIPNPPRVLITTSTASGRDRASGLPEADLAVLAPIDFYPCVRIFLGRVRPFGLLLVETELWPAMLRLAHGSGLKIAVVNGRMTDKAFERYRWIRPFMEPLLDKIGFAALQTQDDADRFNALGLPQKSARVTGNLKYDTRPLTSETTQRTREIIERLGWGNDPILVAGSTRPEGEEEAILHALHAARKRHPNLRLILAPRHIERCGQTAKLLEEQKLNFVTLSFFDLPKPKSVLTSEVSSTKSLSPPPDCLLVNKMGQLAAFYSVGTLAFVGGTLVTVGGHNVLEPALSGKPVMYGPYTESVAEVADTLEHAGGGFRVQNAADLARFVDQFLSYPTFVEKAGRQARETAEHLAGATRRTMEFILPFFTQKTAP